MSEWKAPDFHLTDLQGKTHSLADYRGKIIWLEFWVTWCPSCREMLPKKDLLYRSLQHPGLVFLTVNVTGREAEPDRVFEMIKQTGYRFPVLRDKGRETYDAYGLNSVPSSVIINTNRLIHGIYDETVPLTHVIGEIGKLLSST
ncbi:TlpA family protein disulfide reductase [Paenactinomyces guangxiensis]|uniref:TlpA family protein disulfide reductase n=1 Tax=Paenactinomyces guangxiensis TaxID=1490290 RepID=A0A7W1WPA5_9BACL|nr:TlpA disulfide reductase family protein [Paenactinomyces guangxiensis]MBA4493584.1 TlpA family protein disulfide reductase [Paenactinomyces guangxiensis]MBH8590871.1 TlpA family protein disulfide reductase [Paenactinomyces guangxiensis]